MTCIFNYNTFETINDPIYPFSLKTHHNDEVGVSNDKTLIYNYKDILACQTLLIPLGKTLIIPCGYTITNYGVVSVYGLLEIYGTLTNSGKVMIYDSGTITNYSNNTFNNNGTVNNGTILNSGARIINIGTINSTDTTGKITNYGSIISRGPFNIHSGEQITNYGILDISYGTLTNSGTITGSKGNIIIDASGSISNSGTFIIQVNSSFNNYGLFDNSLNSIFINYSANFYTRATFDNYGSLTNSNTGNIYVKSLSSERLVLSILNIQSSGSLTNSGNIRLSTLNNQDYQNSVIYNYSSNFINTGTIRSYPNTCYFYNKGTIYNTNGYIGPNSNLLILYNGSSDNLTAIFYNYKGTLEVDRGIYNYGTIHNGYNGIDYTTGSTITANTNGLNNYSGTIYNYSGNTITTNNSFNNDKGTIIQNYGTLNINNSNSSINSGTIYNSLSTGTLSINNNYTNTGSIYNYESGTITIASGKTLTSSSGTIINADGMGGCGTATINYGGSYGTITGTVSSGCPNPIP